MFWIQKLGCALVGPRASTWEDTLIYILRTLSAHYIRLWGQGLPGHSRGSGFGLQEPHQGGQLLWRDAGGLSMAVAWDEVACVGQKPPVWHLYSSNDF